MAGFVPDLAEAGGLRGTFEEEDASRSSSIDGEDDAVGVILKLLEPNMTTRDEQESSQLQGLFGKQHSKVVKVMNGSHERMTINSRIARD